MNLLSSYTKIINDKLFHNASQHDKEGYMKYINKIKFEGPTENYVEKFNFTLFIPEIPNSHYQIIAILAPDLYYEYQQEIALICSDYQKEYQMDFIRHYIEHKDSNVNDILIKTKLRLEQLRDNFIVDLDYRLYEIIHNAHIKYNDKTDNYHKAEKQRGAEIMKMSFISILYFLEHLYGNYFDFDKLRNILMPHLDSEEVTNYLGEFYVKNTVNISKESSEIYSHIFSLLGDYIVQTYINNVPSMSTVFENNPELFDKLKEQMRQ